MSDVFFKGLRGKLYLYLEYNAEQKQVMKQLRKKLNASVSFFSQGTKVMLETNGHDFSVEYIAEVRKLLAEYGLLLVNNDDKVDSAEVKSVTNESKVNLENNWLNNEKNYRENNTLTIKQMLRSGQRIVYDGAIIVYGDINPGAEVIAGQNITVIGTCRGLLHAGAFGDTSARIYAANLQSSQIRIAGQIALAPDSADDNDTINVMFSLNEKEQVLINFIGKNSGR